MHPLQRWVLRRRAVAVLAVAGGQLSMGKPDVLLAVCVGVKDAVVRRRKVLLANYLLLVRQRLPMRLGCWCRLRRCPVSLGLTVMDVSGPISARLVARFVRRRRRSIRRVARTARLAYAPMRRSRTARAVGAARLVRAHCCLNTSLGDRAVNPALRSQKPVSRIECLGSLDIIASVDGKSGYWLTRAKSLNESKHAEYG